jgi:hypothetical protein
MSRIGTACEINDSSGLITTPSVGAGSFASAAADGTGITVNSSSGKMELQTAGALLSNGLQRDEISKTSGAASKKGALGQLDAAGGVITLQNTWGNCWIKRLLLMITQGSAGACTVDAGVNVAVAISDVLIDGADVNGKGGVSTNFTRNNIDDKGANGAADVYWPLNYYLTASMKTGAAAGLVGYYEVEITDPT